MLTLFVTSSFLALVASAYPLVPADNIVYEREVDADAQQAIQTIFQSRAGQVPLPLSDSTTTELVLSTSTSHADLLSQIRDDADLKVILPVNSDATHARELRELLSKAGVDISTIGDPPLKTGALQNIEMKNTTHIQYLMPLEHALPAMGLTIWCAGVVLGFALLAVGLYAWQYLRDVLAADTLLKKEYLDLEDGVTDAKLFDDDEFLEKLSGLGLYTEEHICQDDENEAGSSHLLPGLSDLPPLIVVDEDTSSTYVENASSQVHTGIALDDSLFLDPAKSPSPLLMTPLLPLPTPMSSPIAGLSPLFPLSPSPGADGKPTSADTLSLGLHVERTPSPTPSGVPNHVSSSEKSDQQASSWSIRAKEAPKLTLTRAMPVVPRLVIGAQSPSAPPVLIASVARPPVLRIPAHLGASRRAFTSPLCDDGDEPRALTRSRADSLPPLSPTSADIVKTVFSLLDVGDPAWMLRILVIVVGWAFAVAITSGPRRRCP